MTTTLLTRFEASLLEILYAILDAPVSANARAKLFQAHEYQSCLTSPAIRLVEQALAKGMTHWLTRIGGWQQERYLRDGGPVGGSVWERTEPQRLGLQYSPVSLKFLMWLVKNPLGKTRSFPLKKSFVLSSGDQLLVLRALLWMKDVDAVANWFGHQPFAAQPLVALTFTERFTDNMAGSTLEFAPCVESMSPVLECLQTLLAKHWQQMEQMKTKVTDPVRMRCIGSNQAIVLNGYLDAVEQAGRRDLARFVLMALQKIVGTNEEPARIAVNWVRGMEMHSLRLADRTEVYRAASMFLATSARMRSWTEQCQLIGYFDEGYTAAQLWLADWERYDGDRTTQRALQIMSHLAV